MDFYEVLRQAAKLLQEQGKLGYRILKRQFDLDDDALEDVKEELLFSHPVVDEDSRGLIWTGKAQASAQPAIPTKLLTVSETTPATPAGSGEPTAHDEHHASLDVSRSSSGAERRQLTVMFCDLADSTKLSQQIDPEDLREVIRAYQETAANVIEQYEGHIAQYLGDGLLIYFGWPVAHEDDAQRAAHAGLGIVEAITSNLNPRLERDKGVQLTVRIGIHTGPVVVGEMGGSGRHENLATGETVNIAARLEGLAAPNTVMISAATAHLVEGAFALGVLGLHNLKGVAEPVQVFRVLGPIEADVDGDESVVADVPFLVGRDEEMGLLLRRWEQSKEGLGQVVLIRGEAVDFGLTICNMSTLVLYVSLLVSSRVWFSLHDFRFFRKGDEL